MREWLLSHRTRRKTFDGTRRFVTSWLGREQDSPAYRSNGSSSNNAQAQRDAFLATLSDKELS
jgi:hypothetical protein